MITDSIEDIRKKYKGTYLFLELQNKEYLVQYDNDEHGNFTFISPEHGSLLVKEETIRTKLKPYFPKSGLYNLENNAIFFSKNPIRQWKRGLCQENGILTKLSSTNTYVQYIDIDFESVTNLFFPKYPKSTKEAIAILKKETIAISPKFGIETAPKNYKEGHILLYNCFPIGTINNNDNTIVVKHNPLLQEVKDHYYTKEPEWTILPSPK